MQEFASSTGDYDQDNYKNENFPRSVQTQVTGINNRDLTVGFWADSNNANMVNRMDLIANVRLTTAAPKYDWVNTRQIWGLATVNLAMAKIHVESFMQ